MSKKKKQKSQGCREGSSGKSIGCFCRTQVPFPLATQQVTTAWSSSSRTPETSGLHEHLHTCAGIHTYMQFIFKKSNT